MIKNTRNYLEVSEKERAEYLQKLTYKDSAAITEAMMSSKMVFDLKFKNREKGPCALSLTLRQRP